MATKYQGNQTERRALDSYIKLSRAANTVETRINTHLADYGLTLSQFGVLEALYHLGPLPQNALAEKILKSTGNLTTVLDNLCKRDLVKRDRDPDDRRAYRVELTEAGSQLIARLFPVHVGKVVETFAVLSAQEQNQFAQLCRKLGLGQENVPPSKTRQAKGN